LGYSDIIGNPSMMSTAERKESSGSMTGRAITPDEVVSAKAGRLPSVIFDVFNELIARNWNGRQARVMGKEAVDAIGARLGISESEIYRQRFLDVEEVYRRAGWKVDYDKPAYNETYDPFFIFERAR
jgi:hypothetical protein